jgi:hypothetical protein
MIREVMMRALTVFACVLLLAEGAGCAAQQPEKPASPVGAWDITGQDRSKVQYIGTLILTTADKVKLVGHIMWSGTDGSSGREHVTATYDAKGRILMLKGVKLEQAKGLSLGSYKAELSEDGMELKGTWKGSQPIYDAEWGAKRIVFK